MRGRDAISLKGQERHKGGGGTCHDTDIKRPNQHHPCMEKRGGAVTAHLTDGPWILHAIGRDGIRLSRSQSRDRRERPPVMIGVFGNDWPEGEGVRLGRNRRLTAGEVRGGKS